MAVTLRTHFDGDYSVAFQTGPDIWWLDGETQSPLCKRTFQQSSASRNFLPAWDAPGPLVKVTRQLTFLVEASQPRELQGDIVEWDEIYAAVPAPMLSMESTVYPYQFLEEASDGIVTQDTVIEAGIPVGRQILWEYFLASDPTKITLSQGYRLIQLTPNVIFQLGTAPASNATYFQGDPQLINRWKGHIWRRETRLVPVFSLSLLSDE